MPNFNDLQTAISDVSGVQLDDRNFYLSSTECDGNLYWILYADDGYVSSDNKDTNGCVRAFLAL